MVEPENYVLGDKVWNLMNEGNQSLINSTQSFTYNVYNECLVSLFLLPLKQCAASKQEVGSLITKKM